MNQHIAKPFKSILNVVPLPPKSDEQIIAEMREHNKKTMRKILLDQEVTNTSDPHQNYDYE